MLEMFKVLQICMKYVGANFGADFGDSSFNFGEDFGEDLGSDFGDIGATFFSSILADQVFSLSLFLSQPRLDA